MSSARHPTPVNGWIELKPFVLRRAYAKRCVRALVRCVGNAPHEVATAVLGSVRRKSVAAAGRMRSDGAGDLAFCVNILCDLVSQGWRLKTRYGRLFAKPPSTFHS